MHYIKTQSVASAFEKLVELVLTEGQNIITENGQKCKELLNVSVEITNPKLKRTSNKYPFDKKFINEYIDTLLNGSDNNFVYTYHDRIFKYDNKINQFKYIVEKINEEKNTRRAIISIWNPLIDIKETHVPCLNHITFQKRNNELYMTTLFRSNDILQAFHSNAIALISLGEKVAEETNCKLKNYVHHICNAHIYYEINDTELKKWF